MALDIWGIDFKTSDTIAQTLGIPPDSLLRARAGVRHALQVWSEQGHLAAPKERLLPMAEELLGIGEGILIDVLAAEVAEENLVVEATEDGPLYFLAPLHRAELGCAQHIARLLKGAPPWGAIDPAAAIPWVEQQTGLHLSASQRQAVACVLASKVAIITGGPGVGKTTPGNSLLRILRAKGTDVLLYALTGRAAKRLTGTTELKANTVHRLLEFDPKAFQFKRDGENPLDAQLLVIDEVSMMGVVLMNQLLKAVPDSSAVLIVGDVDQWPSVGPGSVLADLIASSEVPTVRLTEIFRQAQSSRIIANAHRINRGEMPLATPKVEASDFYLIEAGSPEDLTGKLIEIALLPPICGEEIPRPHERTGAP